MGPSSPSPLTRTGLEPGREHFFQLIRWPRDPTLRTTAAALDTRLGYEVTVVQSCPSAKWVSASAPLTPTITQPCPRPPKDCSHVSRPCLQRVLTVTSAITLPGVTDMENRRERTTPNRSKLDMVTLQASVSSVCRWPGFSHVP